MFGCFPDVGRKKKSPAEPQDRDSPSGSVQAFYRQNHGKSCRKIMRFNGHPNKVSGTTRGALLGRTSRIRARSRDRPGGLVDDFSLRFDRAIFVKPFRCRSKVQIYVRVMLTDRFTNYYEIGSSRVFCFPKFFYAKRFVVI